MARNFAEAISADYATDNNKNHDVFVSFDFELMDSLTARIQSMMKGDTRIIKERSMGLLSPMVKAG
jgi:hypothetical protein